MASKRFIRSDAHKKKRIARTGWRKPRGWQNKMRLQKRGYRGLVKTGYGTAAAEREVIDGRQLVMVSSVEGAKLVTNKHVVVIKNMGGKKTLEILKILKEKNAVLVEQTVAERIKAIEDNLSQRASVKKKREAAKKAKEEKSKKAEKEAEAKKKEAEAKEAEKSEQEKKAEEKKEKDKLLTKGE